MFFYRGKDCLQKFPETLKYQVNKIINIKQKPMDLLTDQEKVLHNNAKICFICEKSFCNDKNNIKVRHHYHYTGKYKGAAQSACNLQYKILKSIPVVFHNGSSYDFHLIINQLAKDFDGIFSCLGESTEKYITFSICIFKKTYSDKKPIAYQIKCIDSYRHMSQSLSNLVANLAELNKNLPANVLIQSFHSTYQLCDNNIEKLKILLRKGLYLYEYMSSWKKFNEPLPLMKKYYCSELNHKNISDADLAHVKNICDTCNIANLGDYHVLYVSLDVALLADVFENFRDTSVNIDKLDPANYLSAPGLSWQSPLKKTGVKLELLTDENMLLLFEKGIRGSMCNVIHKYAKDNNKYMKNYDVTKESTFLMYVNVNNLYGWAMSKKLPIDNFKWEAGLSTFTEDFIKNYDEESDTGYLFYAYIAYPKNLHKLHADLPFLPHRMKVNKFNKLVNRVYDRNNYSIHIFALKQELEHGFILNKVYSVISFGHET